MDIRAEILRAVKEYVYIMGYDPADNHVVVDVDMGKNAITVKMDIELVRPEVPCMFGK